MDPLVTLTVAHNRIIRARLGGSHALCYSRKPLQPHHTYRRARTLLTNLLWIWERYVPHVGLTVSFELPGALSPPNDFNPVVYLGIKCDL